MDNNFFFGFNKNSEIINGRVAMVSFLVIFFIELIGKDKFSCLLCAINNYLII